MVEFVVNKIEFERYKARFCTLFSQVDFKENPFNENFKYFLAFEFEYIFHELFFEELKYFLKQMGSHSVVFYTIDPSPEEYFYRHFEKYSIFEISTFATDEDLSQIMTKDPGGSPADTICVGSNEVCWFSDSDDWAILGSREWEIAIIGFTNLNIKQKFIKSLSEDGQTMFTSIKTQVDALDDMLGFNKEIKEEYRKLVESYKDRAVL